MDDIARQQDYYTRTANDYETMHVAQFDEHMLALSYFAGLARALGAKSVLDVGAGTGRALTFLSEHLPGATLHGIEPVKALRDVAYANGITPDRLTDGSGECLPFADNAFDFVIETGVLHHVPRPDKVVAEMVRVARIGVLISDCNKLGQGSALLRLTKAVINRLGLWRAMIWLTTRGKMSKWSEGDGLFYSYSVFDNVDLLKPKFPRLFLSNTVPMPGSDLKRGAAEVCVIALRRE